MTDRPLQAAVAARPLQIVRACAIGLGLALLLVGVISGTVLRHVVQIVPIGVALFVLARSPGRGVDALLPIFVFWTLIVALIWLFLLGLSRFANGHYTRAEIVCTAVMMVCSLIGIATSLRLPRRGRAMPRVSAFLMFAVLQLAVMWVSFLGPIANR